MFLNTIVTKSGFGLLRVLDLQGVYKPMLPEILRKFLPLKYLGLRWAFLDSLPKSIGNLPYLENLDVKHTNIITLPSSIWKAKNLWHHYLNEIHFDVSLQRPSDGSLTNLRTLWGCILAIKVLCIVNVYYVMLWALGPTALLIQHTCTCTILYLYLYYTLLVPHTYASYIRHWYIFFHQEIQDNFSVFLTWYQSHRFDFFLAVLSSLILF